MEANAAETSPREPSAFELGVLAGVLLGEGHFGGDGRQPQVTLRMHVRHERLFEWLVATFGGRLYGPYHHAGRSYLQWMVRGAHLRATLVPLLDAVRFATLDGPAAERYARMKSDYGL